MFAYCLFKLFSYIRRGKSFYLVLFLLLAGDETKKFWIVCWCHRTEYFFSGFSCMYVYLFLFLGFYLIVQTLAFMLHTVVGSMMFSRNCVIYLQFLVGIEDFCKIILRSYLLNIALLRITGPCTVVLGVAYAILWVFFC